MPDIWRDLACRKQKERASRIPETWLLPTSLTGSRKDNVLEIPRQCNILSDQELLITEEYDATALVTELASGKLKSVEVVTAFCKRAAIAQQLTNCLTEILFDNAIARAKSLDAELARTGKPSGPLHGLPISLKDTFKIKGYDASIGIASLCFKPATWNSALVDLLLSLGAVLYCKTNVPQTMMALDSHNNVFGRTINPANSKLTAGGSSGGEGALVAMRGSVLGVGTDVGGSIRVPAMCNGLYGVKPSHGRVPYAGQEGGLPIGGSKLAIEATAGPIAHSVRDCELLLRAIGDSVLTLDPDVIAQTWDQQASLHVYLPSPSARLKQPLRIGIVRTDGHTTPLPPIQRLIDDVARTLRASPGVGLTPIEVIDVDILSLLSQCVKISNAIFSIDGANGWFNILESTGEPLSPWLQGRLRRRPSKSVDEVRKLHAQRIELQTKFLDVWWEQGGYWKNSLGAPGQERTLDILICPAAPHPVPPVDRWNTVNYTSAFNLLDLPAGNLPVRRVVEKDLEGDIAGGKVLNGWDKMNQELWAKADRKDYLGSTLSVQVVAPRLMERKLVEAMALVDLALRSLKDTSADRASKL